MKRLEHIKELAEKSLSVLSAVIPDAEKSHVMFKAVSAAVPGLGAIIAAANWWLEYSKEKKIPEKAIDLVCKWENILDDEMLTIKSPEQLNDLLLRHGEKNPTKVFQRAVNHLFAEIKYPELARFLSDLHIEMLRDLEQHFSSFKLSLKEGFSYLLPIETELEILPEVDSRRQPEFFRKIGPLAVDFDAGRIYRRSEVDKVTETFKDYRTILLEGTVASGKSVIVRQTAYELYQEGWTIYMWSLKRTGTFNRDRVQPEIDRLGNGLTLLVIDDIHLAPDEINRLLTFYQPTWPRLLLTTRQVDFEAALRGTRNNFIDLPTIKISPFDASSAIISLYCKEHGIEAAPELINKVTEISKENLWVLAYALVALRSNSWTDVKEDLILDEVKKDLKGIAAQNGTHFVELLIALSVLYRFEILTDARFLEDAFPGSGDILTKLVLLGEAVEKEEPGIHFLWIAALIVGS